MTKLAAFIAAVLFSTVALAQGYPNRPVKVIVPWPPGQATDIAARAVAEKLQKAKAMQAPELKERFISLGMDAVSNTPDEMSAFMRAQQERYGSIIKSQNIKIEQ